MDKIHQISDNTIIKQQAASNRSKSGKFQSALATVLKGKDATTRQAQQKMPLSEVSPVYPQSIGLGQTQFLAQAEQLVEMLNDYTLQLNNPAKSLKDLAPLMNEIKVKAGELIASAGNETLSDSRLKKIVEDVALMANVEYIKFHRGDLL